MPNASATIYHNPNCSTSRNVLQALREHGFEPQVVEYLKTPPDRATLVKLLQEMGMAPRELLRKTEARYDELRLGDAHWTDDELIDQMLAHPVLIQRPIVVTPRGARLCRPKEKLLELLPPER
jgi:arsenate reductase